MLLLSQSLIMADKPICALAPIFHFSPTSHHSCPSFCIIVTLSTFISSNTPLPSMHVFFYFRVTSWNASLPLPITSLLYSPHSLILNSSTLPQGKLSQLPFSNIYISSRHPVLYNKYRNTARHLNASINANAGDCAFGGPQ